MARIKKDEAAAQSAAPIVTEVFEEAPAPKKRARKKKEDAVEGIKEKAGSVKKAAARKPRKKAVVPNFVIQNSVDDGITYEAVLEKVQAAISEKEVSSLDVYVKAEEGKAYYVVNGDIAGAVDLF